MTPTKHHPSHEDLFAYRDGELPHERRTLVEAHVLVCGACRDLMDEMSAVESDLRLRPDDVGAEYYDQMTGSILARIAGEPRVERRRPEPAGDEERRRRVPASPWFGALGAGAAAAAVVVVVVMLAQRQNEWVRAPRPGVVGGPEGRIAAGEADSGTGAGPEAKGKADAKAKGPAESKTVADAGAVGQRQAPALAPVGVLAKREEDTDEPRSVMKGVASEPKTQRADDVLDNRAADAAALRSGMPQRGARQPADAYSAVLQTHGLPPVWDEALVSRDALSAAEGDLRLLYQTGRAGTDSARVRLYLAEAERLRVDVSDPEAIGRIINHYRRAIRLAGPDRALAAVARRRLVSLFQQIGKGR
jgi:anti-sigma factor RsiW